MKLFIWIRRFVKMYTIRSLDGRELLDAIEHSIQRNIEERNRVATELAQQKKISYSQARAWMLYGECTWSSGYIVTYDDL